jgi:hypothetical protein
MAHVLASVAAYETEVRRERQLAGIAAAKAAGKTWGGSEKGRLLTVTKEQVAAVKRLSKQGKIGALLPAVLARLELKTNGNQQHEGSVLTNVRIHTAFREHGIPAFSVLGALSDHYRLIWQFGADPLMDYLDGEP